jgi:hypothetical protein
MMQEKTCKRCLGTFPITQFKAVTKRGDKYVNGVWHGYDALCDSCRKKRDTEKSQRYYQLNRIAITRKARRKFKTPAGRAYFRAYASNRRRTDVNFRLKDNLRKRINESLGRQNLRKTNPTLHLVGCSLEQLKTHLESQWKPGMTWDNHSLHGWHIDHIRPIASFDLTDPTQQKTCFHYTNLQPLWAEENIRKGANLSN